MMAIGIPAEVVRDMLAHAREEAPRECCGLLVGNGESIVRSVRARNVDPKKTRYLIDPEDHFTAIRTARETASSRRSVSLPPIECTCPFRDRYAEANSGSDFLYVIVSLGMTSAAYESRGSSLSP